MNCACAGKNPHAQKLLLRLRIRTNLVFLELSIEVDVLGGQLDKYTNACTEHPYMHALAK